MRIFIITTPSNKTDKSKKRITFPIRNILTSYEKNLSHLHKKKEQLKGNIFFYKLPWLSVFYKCGLTTRAGKRIPERGGAGVIFEKRHYGTHGKLVQLNTAHSRDKKSQLLTGVAFVSEIHDAFGRHLGYV